METSKQAIYLRKSRDVEGDSIEKQRQSLERLAEIRGYDNYTVFHEVESSIDFNRPKLVKMLEQAAAGVFDVILCAHIDRLGRDVGGLYDVKRICIENNIIIVTPQEVHSFDSDSSELKFGFDALMSDYEYKRTRYRLSRGKLDAVINRGEWVQGGSSVPFGYKYNRDTKKLELCPEKAPIARELFEKAANGVTILELVRELKERGIKSRYGKYMHPSTIQTLLRNRTYLGEISYHSTRLDETATYTDAHPALIDEELFKEVDSMIRSKATNLNRSTPRVKTSIDGLVYCYHCGYAKVMERVAGKYHIRNCRYDPDCRCRGVSAELVENTVLERVKEYGKSLTEQLDRIKLSDTSQHEETLQERINQLEKEKKEKERSLDRLLDVFLDGTIDKATYEKRKEDVERQKNAVEVEVQKNKKELDTLDTDTLEERIKELLGYLEDVESGDVEDRNLMLRKLINKIRISRMDKDVRVYVDWRNI